MELHRAQLFSGAFQVALVVKNPAANAGDLGDVGSIPGWDDPLEEGMATHSSILAWRDAMDRGESPWGHRESHANSEKRQEAEGKCQSRPFPPSWRPCRCVTSLCCTPLCMKWGHSSHLCSGYCKCNGEIKEVMDMKNTLTMKQLYADANWHRYHVFIITISQSLLISKKAGTHF